MSQVKPKAITRKDLLDERGVEVDVATRHPNARKFEGARVPQVSDTTGDFFYFGQAVGARDYLHTSFLRRCRGSEEMAFKCCQRGVGRSSSGDCFLGRSFPQPCKGVACGTKQPRPFGDIVQGDAGFGYEVQELDQDPEERGGEGIKARDKKQINPGEAGPKAFFIEMSGDAVQHAGKIGKVLAQTLLKVAVDLDQFLTFVAGQSGKVRAAGGQIVRSNAGCFQVPDKAGQG